MQKFKISRNESVNILSNGLFFNFYFEGKKKGKWYK